MNSPEFSRLRARGETRQIEFKGAASFDGDFRPHIAATIAALANTPGGGTIVVGVANDAARTVQGLTPEQIGTFDPTTINNFLRQRFSPPPKLHVEHHVEGSMVVLLIQVAEFDDVPIVAVKQVEDSKGRCYAREGDLLIRNSGCESKRIASADDMRELLGRALLKKGDTLLHQIQALLKGTPQQSPAEPLRELHARNLPGWTRGGVPERNPGLAWWEVRLLPSPLPAKPLNPERAAEIVERSAVSLRGWDFPHYHRPHVVFRGDRIENITDWQEFDEAWSFSYSGVFSATKLVWSERIPQSQQFDHPHPPERVLDFVNITWTLTEIFRFATNIVESLGAESLWVEVSLNSISRRRLGTFDFRRRLPHGDFTAAEDCVVLEGNFAAAELSATWREIAADWTSRIFTVFQYPGAKPEVLHRIQQDLLDRRW